MKTEKGFSRVGILNLSGHFTVSKDHTLCNYFMHFQWLEGREREGGKGGMGGRGGEGERE